MTAPRALSEKELAHAALAAAGHSFWVTSGEILLGGRINDTWKVETDSGARVLRWSPVSRRSRQLAFELSVMTHLRSSDCRVPRVFLDHQGATHGILEGRLFSWMEWIEPRESLSTPKSALQALLLPIFDALRKFDAPFRPVAETRIFAQAFDKLLQSPDLQQRQSLAGSIRQLHGKLQAWEASSDLPSGVIHADIHPPNILRDPSGELWLIDFDDAHVGTRALDWVLAALEFSWRDSSFSRPAFESLCSELMPPWATEDEHKATPKLLRLLALKFASWENDLGTPLEENRYLRLVEELLDT